MRKTLFTILGIVTVFSSALMFSISSKAESATQDQYCAPGPETGYDTLGSDFVPSQTFKPKQNRLSEIFIKISGQGLTGTTPVTLTLKGPGFDGPVLATKTVLPTVTSPGYRSWAFSTPVSVTPDETYRLILEESGSGSVYWFYGSGDENCDGQNRTYAFRDSTRMSWDFNYYTAGYSYVEPGSANQTETSTGPSASSVSGESLGATTTSIAKPSSLTAAYSKDDNGVKLTWKASTTADIDGYKIFRSESEKTSFTKIKEVTKEKLDEIDQTVSAEKTYYYQVRAYKGVNQSASSNTATVTAPENIPPAKPVKLKVVDSTDSMIKITWRKTQDTSVTGYTINLYKQGEKIRTSELQANDELYSFLGLDPLTVYKVELIAKNAKGETSSPAITYGYTSVPEEIGVIMDSIKLLAAILVLILLLVLAFRTKKHYQKK